MNVNEYNMKLRKKIFYSYHYTPLRDVLEMAKIQTKPAFRFAIGRPIKNVKHLGN